MNSKTQLSSKLIFSEEEKLHVSEWRSDALIVYQILKKNSGTERIWTSWLHNTTSEFSSHKLIHYLLSLWEKQVVNQKYPDNLISSYIILQFFYGNLGIEKYMYVH